MYTADTFVLANARAGVVAVVDASGNQITSFSSVATPPANATLTQVAQSSSSVTILASNVNRKQFMVFNVAGQPLFLAFAATATQTAFSVLIPQNGNYIGELQGYTGVVSGIWKGAGSGNAVVTEVTP